MIYIIAILIFALFLQTLRVWWLKDDLKFWSQCYNNAVARELLAKQDHIKTLQDALNALENLPSTAKPEICWICGMRGRI